MKPSSKTLASKISKCHTSYITVLGQDSRKQSPQAPGYQQQTKKNFKGPVSSGMQWEDACEGRPLAKSLLQRSRETLK